MQKALQFGDKTAKCNDQNNPELFANPIDSLAAAGAILAEVWLDDDVNNMITAYGGQVKLDKVETWKLKKVF